MKYETDKHYHIILNAVKLDDRLAYLQQVFETHDLEWPELNRVGSDGQDLRAEYAECVDRDICRATEEISRSRRNLQGSEP